MRYRERTERLIPGVGRTLLPMLLAGLLAGCPGDDRTGGDGEASDGSATAEPGGAAPGADTGAAPAGDTAARADPARWIGTLHPPVPEGVEKRAGSVVTPPGQDAAEAELGFSHVIVGGAHQLWLSELLRREPDGTPVWRVLDAVEVGPVGPEEWFTIYGCQSPDRDWGVAAVMRMEDQETLTDARRAWGVDRAGTALEPILAEGIGCKNPGAPAP